MDNQNIADLLSHIINNDVANAQDTFDSIMAGKSLDAIEMAKVDIAADMFGTEE